MPSRNSNDCGQGKCAGIAALAAMLAATLGVWAAPAMAQPSATPRPPQKIYNNVCGYCHETRVGPELLGRNLPTQYVTMMARSGMNGMPAFREAEISNTELANLAQWINSSQKKPAPAPAKEGSH